MKQELSLTMITHRSIEEGIAMEKGKNSMDYYTACSVVEMNELDMLRLGIEENTPVRIQSAGGEVIVRAITGVQSLPPGLCHIRQGVWANQIVPGTTQSAGAPQYSGFQVTVTPAPGQRILPARELVLRSVGMWNGEDDATHH